MSCPPACILRLAFPVSGTGRAHRGGRRHCAVTPGDSPVGVTSFLPEKCCSTLGDSLRGIALYSTVPLSCLPCYNPVGVVLLSPEKCSRTPFHAEFVQRCNYNEHNNRGCATNLISPAWSMRRGWRHSVWKAADIFTILSVLLVQNWFVSFASPPLIAPSVM